MTRSLMLALLMALPLVALADDSKPEKGDKAEKFDAAKLVGEWKITEGTRSGDKKEPDSLKGAVVITKDKISLKSMDMDFVFSYKLDDKKDPVAIDMETLEPDAIKGTKAQGIIKIVGDKFTLCYNPMGGARPTKFESTKDDGNFLFVHTKAKKDEKKPEKELKKDD